MIDLLGAVMVLEISFEFQIEKDVSLVIFLYFWQSYLLSVLILKFSSMSCLHGVVLVEFDKLLVGLLIHLSNITVALFIVHVLLIFISTTACRPMHQC